jgi:hypothetical protein
MYENLREDYSNFYGKLIIEEAGNWIQQEASKKLQKA